MTRQPKTQREMPAEDSDDTPIPDSTDRPVGRRFLSTESETWAIEQELVDDGATLPNRAIPMQYRDLSGPEALRQAIEDESGAANPNKNAIGFLNEQLAARTEDTDA